MIRRLSIYLNEMFPMTAILGTALTAFSIQLLYLRLSGLPVVFHFQMLQAAIYLTCISLLIRVMDEFKDFEDDKKKFPNRPLPSGKVQKTDLKFLGVFCVANCLLVSASSWIVFGWAILSLGFTYLMLKWFFIEKQMRESLPLAFLSHHPLVLFNFIYLMLGMMTAFEGVGWDKADLILPLCLLFTNWEFARKIRSPDEETDYTTYSKIFGPRIAVSVCLILQLFYTFTVFRIFSELDSPMFLRGVFGFLMTLMIFPSARFLVTLKLKAPLKISAESQILVVIGFLMAAALI